MFPRPPAVLLALGAAAALLLSGCGGDASASETTIRFRYSNFQPGLITATVGEPVTFTLQNDDPIAHEWIVGSEAVHERHRNGTDRVHNTLPTEVSIPALSSHITTVTFTTPGDYQYICHLPGHEAYGMIGTVRVAGD